MKYRHKIVQCSQVKIMKNSNINARHLNLPTPSKFFGGTECCLRLDEHSFRKSATVSEFLKTIFTQI